MPAMLEDPARPIIHRTSGPTPHPRPGDTLPSAIVPRQVTLRDRITAATLMPFSSAAQVPASLLAYLCDQFNREIELGDTYPMLDPLSISEFGPYWFGNFGAAMLMGDEAQAQDVGDDRDWSKECLGSFYVKPNYPGRSSHVCNGGFLVTDAARNRGVGRLMGECYLEWAPMLGYTYSVFNLVYETNVASCRIWDALGFKRIGRVKGAGQLKSYPGQFIDALIYGRDLGPEGEDYLSEERFDKIKFYLKHGKYPNGADRAEKSRLRSAVTHYKLLDDDRLMLKDKEVIPDGQKQYEIARATHVQQHHAGINKTTGVIAEKYHWVRIKETVGLVIRNCHECKEVARSLVGRSDGSTPKKVNGTTGNVSAAGRVLSLPRRRSREEMEGGDIGGEAVDEHQQQQQQRQQVQVPVQQQTKPPQPAQPRLLAEQLSPPRNVQPLTPPANRDRPEPPRRQELAISADVHPLSDYAHIPLDARMMSEMRQHLARYPHEEQHPPPHHFSHHHQLPAHGFPQHSMPPAHTDYQALLEIDVDVGMAVDVNVGLGANVHLDGVNVGDVVDVHGHRHAHDAWRGVDG